MVKNFVILLIGGGLKTVEKHKAVFIKMQKKTPKNKKPFPLPRPSWAETIKISSLFSFMQRIYFQLNFFLPFHPLFVDIGYVAAGEEMRKIYCRLVLFNSLNSNLLLERKSL